MAIKDLYPLTRPTLDLNFAGSRTVDPRITFTRASTATYFDEFGVMRTAPANTSRIDFDPVTGECKGLLIEEQRTNLLTYSEQFDNAAWVKARTTIAANTIVAPDGTLTADKLVEDTTASAAHYARSGGSLTASAVYTVSVFTKAAERTSFYIGFGTSTGWAASGAAVFDLQTGNCRSSNAAVVADMTPIGGGWYHCIATTTKNATTGTATFDLTLLDTYIGTGLYDGDGTSGIYIWGAQLEAGSFPTSYIKTEASQVTCAADSAAMTGSNFSSWYRQDEGTLYAEFQTPVDMVANQCAVSIHGGSAANYFSIGTRVPTAVVGGQIRVSGGTTQNIGDFGAGAASFIKTVFAAKSGDFAISANGAAVATNTSIMPYGLNTLFIGGITSMNQSLTIRKLSYYPKRLSNAQLQALTT